MTALDLQLGPADLDRDLEDILAIDRATFYNPWTREMYEWEARHSDVSRLYIARPAPDARIVAYCAGWVIFDELHINNLAVHPDWRRRGIGSRLIEYALAEAAREGAVRATLEVRASNTAARQLYERAGFTQAGVRPRYYRDPEEDALILWRGEPRPSRA